MTPAPLVGFNCIDTVGQKNKLTLYAIAHFVDSHRFLFFDRSANCKELMPNPMTSLSEKVEELVRLSS